MECERSQDVSEAQLWLMLSAAEFILTGIWQLIIREFSQRTRMNNVVDGKEAPGITTSSVEDVENYLTAHLMSVHQLGHNVKSLLS